MAEESMKERARAAGGRQTILVGGGARSGKSRFALALARRLGERRTFIATAQPGDDEMRERIGRHRLERGSGFATIEEPTDLAGALARLTDAGAKIDVAVVDCLTLWLSNLLMRGDDDARVLAVVDELAAFASACPYGLVLVTNEVGLGMVPETPLGRRFRDLAGFMHQRLARAADAIYVGALGMMIRLRPAPMQAYATGETP